MSRSEHLGLAFLELIDHLHHTCAVAGCDRAFAWCEIHCRDP